MAQYDAYKELAWGQLILPRKIWNFRLSESVAETAFPRLWDSTWRKDILIYKYYILLLFKK